MNKLNKISLILCLVLIAFSGYGAGNPHDVIYNHLYHLQKDHFDVDKSAQSFHPDLGIGVRRNLAENLKQILDARGLYIYTQSYSRDPNYLDSLSDVHLVHLHNSLPSITIEKYGDEWYYSKAVEKEVPRLFKQTFPSWSLSLINQIPASLQERVFGIRIWKYIGFLLILLVSLILFKTAEKVSDKVMDLSIWNRLQIDESHHIHFHKIARFLGFYIFFEALHYFMPLLMLDISVSAPLFRWVTIAQTIVIMFILFRIINILAAYAHRLTAATDSKVDDQLVPILIKFLKVFAFLFALFRILILYDVNLTAIIAGLSIGGIALALAAQDTVKNLIGSALIFFDKPFQIGDYIVAMGFEGTVEEVGFRSCRIRKVDTSLISVPNGELMNSAMTNYGIRKFRLFEATLGFTYGSKEENLKAFIQDLRQAFSDFEKIQTENHFVNLRNLSDSSIDVFIRVFIDAQDFRNELLIREELIYKVMQLAKKNGLSFAFPSTSIYVETSSD